MHSSEDTDKLKTYSVIASVKAIQNQRSGSILKEHTQVPVCE